MPKKHLLPPLTMIWWKTAVQVAKLTWFEAADHTMGANSSTWGTFQHQFWKVTWPQIPDRAKEMPWEAHLWGLGFEALWDSYVREMVSFQGRGYLSHSPPISSQINKGLPSLAVSLQNQSCAANNSFLTSSSLLCRPWEEPPITILKAMRNNHFQVYQIRSHFSPPEHKRWHFPAFSIVRWRPMIEFVQWIWAEVKWATSGLRQ